MDIDLLIAGLQAHPQVQLLLSTIRPYLPVIIREGESFYNDFISYAVEGKWTELDESVWTKMTEEEKDALSNQVLIEARESVDNQFSRNKTAREVAFKTATSIISAML
jgi:hypothetical protein